MPIDRYEYVSIKIAASEIVQHSAVAYWAGRDEGTLAYHHECVVRELEKLADKLGYDLVKRAPVTNQPSSE